MRKRILAALVCVGMMLCILPAIAYADEVPTKQYLALGDSITAGYGLDDPAAESFVALFAEANDLEADDSFARSGMTSSELMSMLLTDADLAAKVAQADVITITIGGNDLMGALYSYLANAYNAAVPGASMTAADIETILAGTDQQQKAEMIAFASQQMEGFLDSSQATMALASLGENLTQIVTGIKSVNPDVKLIVANQYNPYGYLATLAAGTAYEATAQALSSTFDAGAQQINGVLALGAKAGLYTIADTYTPFAAAAQNPCNAGVSIVAIDPLTVDIDLDFHPNAYGHALIAQACTTALHPSAAFADVDPAAWYVDALDWAVANGILNGYGDTGLMAPESSLTRAEMAQILWNATGQPEVDAAMLAVLDAFADVDASDWYAQPLAWAASNGLLVGFGQDMGPNETLSREQMAVVLMRYAAILGVDVSGRADLSAFPDAASVSDWAADAMSWAVSAGVVDGIGTEGASVLAPQGDCIRAQMAQLLMNLLAVD